MKEIYHDFIQDISAFGGLPFYLVVILIFLPFNTSISLKLALGLAFCYILTILIRLVFFKKRPDKQAYKGIIEKINASSFPSLHSMRITFLGLILIFYFNNLLATIILSFLMVCVYTSRLILKKHYLPDVIAGIVLGLSLFFIFFFYQKLSTSYTIG